MMIKATPNTGQGPPPRRPARAMAGVRRPDRSASGKLKAACAGSELAGSGPRESLLYDAVFVHLTPTRAIKYFTAYDAVAKWTVGKAYIRVTS